MMIAFAMMPPRHTAHGIRGQARRMMDDAGWQGSWGGQAKGHMLYCDDRDAFSILHDIFPMKDKGDGGASDEVGGQ